MGIPSLAATSLVWLMKCLLFKHSQGFPPPLSTPARHCRRNEVKLTETEVEWVPYPTCPATRRPPGTWVTLPGTLGPGEEVPQRAGQLQTEPCLPWHLLKTALAIFLS